MKKLGKVIILTTSILTGAAAVPLSPASYIKTEASSTVKTPKTSYQTTANLNIRTGPSTRYKTIVTIPKGKIISATEKNGSWLKVSYTYSVKGKNVTKSGWAASQYTKEYNHYISTAKTLFFIKKTAKLYSHPDTRQKPLYTIPSHNGYYSTQKAVNSIGQTWYRITYKGKSLYVNSSYVTKNNFSTFSSAHYKIVKDTWLYQGYGNTYKKLKQLKKGTVISSSSKVENWYKVRSGNVSGYVYSGNVSKYTPVTYKTASISTSYYFTSKTAQLYPAADTLHTAAYTISAHNGFASNKKVTNNLGQTFYQVSFNGKTLYLRNIDATRNSFSSFSTATYAANKNTYFYKSFGSAYSKRFSIPKGQKFTISKKINNWYSVSYKGYTGYVSTADFSKYVPVTYHYKNTSLTYYFTNKTAKLYTSPNTHAAAAYSVGSQNGFTSSKLAVNSLGESFYQVSFNGKTLYLRNTDAARNSFSSFSTATYVANKNTYFYKSFGSAYSKRFSIPKGQKFKISKKINNWYSVSYKGYTGYVSTADFSKYVPVTYHYTYTRLTYYFTNKTAKLYTSPNSHASTAYSVGSQNGFASSKLAVNSLGESFYQVSFNGKTLYLRNTDAAKNSFSSLTSATYVANRNTYLYKSYGSAYSKLLSIPRGQKFTISKKINNWYTVSYKGYTGYVLTADFSKYVPVTYHYKNTSLTYYFTNKTAKLYTSPNSHAPAAYSVGSQNGFASSKLAVNSLGESFYQVSFNGKTLYLRNIDAAKNSFSSFSAATYVTNKNTYLYKSYGSAYSKLLSIPKGQKFTISKKINNWYTVSYKGKTGYAYYGDFSVYQPPVKETPINNITYITTAGLNLRNSPTVSASILKVIPDHTIVVAKAETDNHWYKVTYGGKTGYVSGTYIKQVRTGDPLTNYQGYQFLDLRTQTPVSASEINRYIANYVKSTGKRSILTNKGQAFIDAGKKYGVNALYLAAHAIHESAYGTSAISLSKNNLFGFGAYDADPFIAAYHFSSVEACISYIAQEIKSTYLNPNNWKDKGNYLGFSTKDMGNSRLDENSEGMNFFYASDPNWGKEIAQHMQNIHPYNRKECDNASINTSIPARPSVPSGSDVFPAGVTAVVMNKDGLVLNSAKGKYDHVKTLKKGTSFTLVQKTNDFWVQVRVSGKTYWTNGIKFDNYKNYISVKNLGMVSALDGLNFRTSPSTLSTKSSVIKILSQSTYVSIILTTKGSLTMDSTKKWYNVRLADGKTGWVSAYYITMELK